MNDIERQIEDDYDDNIVREDTSNDNSINDKVEGNIEENNVNNKNNRFNNKYLIYIIGIVSILGVIGVIVYFFVVKDNDEDNKVLDEMPSDSVSGSNEEEDANKEVLGYVTCDDNTTLLNVRNSTSGDVIDGLSCFRKVTILEELEGTDNCNKWYKITYNKRGKSYTGYSCGTYISKKDIDASTENIISDLIDKANSYYEGSAVKPYCDYILGEKKDITFNEEGNELVGEYVKSKYKTLDELKNYLLSFLDKSLIKDKIELSDISSPKYFDNYYVIDDNLYCRNYTGVGFMSFYTGNYDYEVVSVSKDKIKINIAYEYLDEETIDDSKCNLNNLSNCPNSKFNYEIGKMVIEKINGNYIITKMDFHK